MDTDDEPVETPGADDGWGALSALPGNPIMWVLILSELLVFGAFFGGYSAARILDPQGFAAAQASADRLLGGINTGVLVTSGLLAAFAVRATAAGRVAAVRRWLAGAGALGLIFLGIKWVEYADKIAHGYGLQGDHTWFTLYYLMTGFHALHVVMGLVILAIVARDATRENVETGAAFWHMVDLIWVLLYPIVYLVR